MKMMIVIVNDRDAEAVVDQLVGKEFRVTQVATTGGFLKRGNTTLLIGLEEERVDAALEVIRQACSEPVQEGQRRATVFVLDVDRYAQL
jgi:uncharacterized protein YaaQ